MAIIYEEEKNYTEALDYYNRSLQLKEEIGDRPGIANILTNIGGQYFDRNMLSEAETYLLRAKLITDSIGEKSGQMELYLNLSLLYNQKGQFREAFLYQKDAASIKDSIYNQEKEEITRKEMSYEIEKKEIAAKADYEKQIAVEKADKLRGIAEVEKRRSWQN